jgi:chitinase
LRRFLLLAARLVCLAGFASLTTWGQLVPLQFRPVDSEYSFSLDRIIMVSANPDQLHIYDPVSNSDVAVGLPKTPLDVSVGPDGMHAAVMHDALVSYVNLATANVEKTFSVPASGGKVVLGTEYAYVIPGSLGTAISIYIPTGLRTIAYGLGSGGRLNTKVNVIYGTRDGTSPNDIERYDVSGGAISNVSDSPYHGDYSICGDVWFSPDQTRIYNSCGTVFRASTDPSKDMTYAGSFPGIGGIQSLSSSEALKRVAVVPPSSSFLYLTKDDEVRLFDSEYLNEVGRFALPDFLVGGNAYQAHARALFFQSIILLTVCLAGGGRHIRLTQRLRCLHN